MVWFDLMFGGSGFPISHLIISTAAPVRLFILCKNILDSKSRLRDFEFMFFC